jgi:hypothetical protein
MKQFICSEASWLSIELDTRRILIKNNDNYLTLTAIINMVVKVLHKYETTL